MAVKVKIEGGDLVIRVPMNPSPQASKSGKTLIVASTHGNIETEAKVQGKNITLGLNAYISANGQ